MPRAAFCKLMCREPAELQSIFKALVKVLKDRNISNWKGGFSKERAVEVLNKWSPWVGESKHEHRWENYPKVSECGGAAGLLPPVHPTIQKLLYPLQQHLSAGGSQPEVACGTVLIELPLPGQLTFIVFCHFFFLFFFFFSCFCRHCLTSFFI